MRISKRHLHLAVLSIFLPFAVSVAFTSDPIGNGLAENEPLQLEVSLSQRTLQVIEGGSVVATYPVAVGRPGHSTPKGAYRTGRIQWNPSWNPPPRKWASGLKARGPGDPRNPMQAVKIYFREPWYFIHGTNDPASIGQAASRGCVRMLPEDAKALARRIESYGGGVPLIITS